MMGRNSSWSVPKELKPLSKRDIEDFLNDSKKAKAALSQAYKTAADPAEWEADHAETMQEAREKAAAKAANADELADSDEEEAGSKKRKRKSEGGKKEANGKKAKGGKRGKVCLTSCVKGFAKTDDYTGQRRRRQAC